MLLAFGLRRRSKTYIDAEAKHPSARKPRTPPTITPVCDAGLGGTSDTVPGTDEVESEAVGLDTGLDVLGMDAVGLDVV